MPGRSRSLIAAILVVQPLEVGPACPSLNRAVCASRLGPFQCPPVAGSSSLPGSKRNVVLYPLSHPPDLLDQVGEIAAMLDEVDVRAVDHEKRGLRVVVEILPE